MRSPDELERNLREHFAELKREEADQAPPFDRTWAAARGRARSRRRRATAGIALAGLAAAAVALLVVIGEDRRHLADPGPSPTAGGGVLPRHTSTLRSSTLPTHFLLESPAPLAVDLERGVRPFRYRLDHVLAASENGVE